jgi:hypothetical protein
MGKVLVTVFVVMSAVSVLQLSAIQHRLIKANGLRFFWSGQARLSDIYWRELSVPQRIRLWTGLLLFTVLLLIASTLKVLELVRS